MNRRFFLLGAAATPFVAPVVAAMSDGVALQSAAHPMAHVSEVGEWLDLNEAAIEDLEFTTDDLIVKTTYRLLPMYWSAGQ